MKIAQGLFDRMVLQRDGRDRSDAEVSGVCGSTGDVVARVTKRGRSVPGFNRKKVGKAARGQFRARLAGIPVGGPYDVELRVGDEKSYVRSVLVGDVWVLGGQSNMQGCGVWTNRAKPHPMVRAFYCTDRWDIAEDPIHNLWDAVDPVHHRLAGGRYPGPGTAVAARRGVGPGVPFGQAMYRATGVPQGLIAAAHGGTSMTQWDPKLAKSGAAGDSLYGAMMRRCRKNGGEFAGIAWYQGESDSSPGAAPHYTTRMIEFVRAIRRDLRNPRLPFVLVQLGRYNGTGFSRWNSVQEQQRRLPDALPNVATVPAVDLPLDDGIHIGSFGCVRLGERLAEAMRVLRGDRKARPPIALKRVAARSAANGLGSELVVEFDNVVGALRGPGRPLGFALLDGEQPASAPYHVEVQGNKAILYCSQQLNDLETLMVQYGLGTDPPCNITDDADRAVQVFGPIAIGKARGLTVFAKTMLTTDLLPSAGKLRNLSCPNGTTKTKWKPVKEVGGFIDMHHAIGATAPDDRLIYFATRFECVEPMKLAVCLGYDGPVKLWVDRKQLFHDPEGTNPAWPDKAKRTIAAGKGKHDVLVALGTNGGRAWGIFLRLERLGLRKRQLENPGSYAMPRWVD